MTRQTHPKALLLGDSIRGQYQPLVAEALKESAEVVGPADNCQYALYTLTRLPTWLEELGTPQVVHWNNGIHDVGHNLRRRPIQMPLDVYLGNLTLILDMLQSTDAQVIWASTTPVHPDLGLYGEVWEWRNEEIDAYNAAASQLMTSRGIPIDDLHAVVAADPDAMLAEDQLHLSEGGQAECAEAVIAAIRPYLPK
jgi:lysophospholipase L1-like esterase